MRFWLIKRGPLGTAGLALVLVMALLLAAWQGMGLQAPSPGPEQRRNAASEMPGENNPPVPDEPMPGTADTVSSDNSEGYADDYYVEYRLERERSRGRQVELLRSIINDPNAGPESRSNAQERLLQISLELDQEVSVENILRAKGLQDVVVFFQDEAVTVVVPQSVTPEQGTTVVNLVARATGVTPENIMVIAREDGRL